MYNVCNANTASPVDLTVSVDNVCNVDSAAIATEVYTDSVENVCNTVSASSVGLTVSVDNACKIDSAAIAGTVGYTDSVDNVCNTN